MERKEVPFRNRTVRHLKGMGIFAYAIESDTTEYGIADAYALIKKRPIWMEFKHVEEDEHVFAHSVRFRPGQERFLRDHVEQGGYGLVVVKSPSFITFSSIEYVFLKRIDHRHSISIRSLAGMPSVIEWIERL